MKNDKIKNTIDQFLNPKTVKKNYDKGEEEICDLQTGECYSIKSKDGLVERINKKFITEDGRQLLQD
jgi:hypothetical protein